MMRDTALWLPKVRGYTAKCGFAHDRTNGKFRIKLTSHNVHVILYPKSAMAPCGVVNQHACARVVHY